MSRPGPDPSVSDTEIIRAIVTARPPALGTTDIADRIDLSQQATSRHLERLCDDGKLNTENCLAWTSGGRRL